MRDFSYIRSVALGFALVLLISPGTVCAVLSTQTQTSTAGKKVSAQSSKQVQEAYAAAQRGNASQALATVDAVLRERPDFAPAYKLRGMLLEDSGDDTGAATAYRSALKFSPDDADLLLKVGTLELLSGHQEQAIALLQRRVQTMPGDKEGNYYLAQAYHLNGNNELALSSIRRAVKAAPDEAPVLQKYGELLCSSGDNVEALQLLMKAQHNDPALPRIQFDLAVASYNNMDLQAAASYAAREAEVEPNNLPDLSLLASVQMKLGQWSDAQANLLKVLARNSDDATSTLALGQCDLELKSYPAAIDILKRALQLDPTQVQVHYLLSRAYSGLGDTPEAQHEAALHREMMSHISFSMPKAELRQQAALSEKAQQLLIDGQETQAVHLFETETKGPYVTRGSAWMAVGGVYLSMGNTQAAERCFERAKVLAPQTHGLHAYMGTVALQNGDLSGAETNFLAELAVDPNHPLALGELGEVRYRQGRWAEAAELLTRSKTTIPSLLFFLAATDFQLGRTQAADLAAEAVAAYGNSEPAIMAALDDLLKRNGQNELASRLGPKS